MSGSVSAKVGSQGKDITFTEFVVLHTTYNIIVNDRQNEVGVSGLELEGAHVIVVGDRKGIQTGTNAQRRKVVETNRTSLEEFLNAGSIVYGVNTGFGGSAVTRTEEFKCLQVGLVQMLNSGTYQTRPYESTQSRRAALRITHYADSLPTMKTHTYRVSDLTATTMPIKWVRGAMLIRANTLLRGHSGVSLQVVKNIFKLINQNITPVVPMRGSISASGDLTPLSYIASTLQGNLSTLVFDHSDDNHRVVPADQALRHIGMEPLIFGAKEGLSIVNGLAFSSAVGIYAGHDALQLATLTQMLTAMAVEALGGHAESFHPFIAEAKNDKDVQEISRNILAMLEDSKLAKGLETPAINVCEEATASTAGTILAHQEMPQDRYALRTASQWIAPPSFEVMRCYVDIEAELNSTSDNPIFDSSESRSPRIFNGGNFQGTKIALAMDKTRSAIQLLGKLVFAQCSEIINPKTSNGLPANVAATDPSLDYACKGIDINMAAYLSELGMLAGGVGPHVQSAELHNQSINSLALLSGRKTNEAIEVFQTMCASYLYVLCQALDVRVMQNIFFKKAKEKLRFITATIFGLEAQDDNTEKEKGRLAEELWGCVKKNWEITGTYDLVDRVSKTLASVAPILLSHVLEDGITVIPGATPSAQSARAKIMQWQDQTREMLSDTYAEVRTTHFANYAAVTPEYLSTHNRTMYTYIRKDLAVPMFQGLADSPTPENGKKSIGGYVSLIELAIKERKVQMVAIKALRALFGPKGIRFPDEEQIPDPPLQTGQMG